MNGRRIIGYSVMGGLLAAAAATAAVRVGGQRVRRRTDPALDELLTEPEGVRRHHTPLRDGGSLLVADHGPSGARPVVCLHGVTLGWRVWDPLLRLAGDTHRMLAWDMRGHGESRAGDDGVSLEAAAGDLAELLEQLDLHDAIVIGHSMGGMVLMRALLDEPLVRERVAGAVFVATSASPFALPGLEKGVGLVASSVGNTFINGLTRGPWYGYGDNDLSAAMVRLAFGEKGTAAMVEQVRAMLADLRRDTARQAGAAILGHDVRARLGEITVPASVIVGTKDLLTPPVHARQLAARLGDAELITLHGVGHQVMQEAPEELANLLHRLERRLSV